MYHDKFWARSIEGTADLQDGFSESFRSPFKFSHSLPFHSRFSNLKTDLPSLMLHAIDEKLYLMAGVKLSKSTEVSALSALHWSK